MTRLVLHTPSDDPRVDILARALLQESFNNGAFAGDPYRPARDLLARLDAAAPARDDALARWLDTEIAEADRISIEAWHDADRHKATSYDARAETLREVRDRLGSAS